MGVLRRPGADLVYDVLGDDGPWVVQLHGLTSSRRRDDLLGLGVSHALTAQRVLRYDARGHGASTGDVAEESYRWDRLADDLLALLDAIAPGEHVHGVGPSMGTGTLLHAAVREPQRFASLALLVPPTAGATRKAQADAYRRNADLVERHGIDALATMGSATPVPPTLSDAPPTTPDVPERLLPAVLRGAASTDLPNEAVLRTVSMPSLVLGWVDDPAHPLSTARLLHDVLPNSRMAIARTPRDVLAWPGLVRAHLGSNG
ncbi:alpha/beta hydrolase [Microbacterium sp. ET2]|uniref:alpha/beta fold hydrolase n=1 Tax=Microbacterium albipurpureum TaxID=3050384 RepID=UPI00259C8B99|nr:alpha/beta hydrolase [Microbacterium sp. ET2 (Ac-2212)]WJL94237.1 alpha/beta hydrolase [Microbacterium sp. ET2 (Ac-2212)]